MAGSEMVQPIPPDCVPSREGRIQLLEAFNLNWQVLSFNYGTLGRINIYTKSTS